MPTFTFEEKQIIDQAITYLQEGWCQNALFTPGGEVCARGAINKAAHHAAFECGPLANSICIRLGELVPDDFKVRGALVHLVTLFTDFTGCLPHSLRQFIYFNNDPATTQEDIILLFKTALAS